MTKYDHETAQNALCLYEAMLDARSQFNAHESSGVELDEGNSWLADLEACWQGNGSYEMRDIALELAGPLDELWHKIEGELGDDCWDGLAWDFEFLPAMLEHVDWSRRCLSDGAEQAARELGKTHAVSEWLSLARHYCKTLWAYPELVDDHEDLFDMHREAGVAASEAAQLVGEKYDLTRADKW